MQIHYRTIRDGEEDAASAVVIAAFEKFIAPGFSDEGIEEFRGYAHAASIRARRHADHPHHQVIAIAPAGTTHGERTWADETIIGIGEVREWQHLSMLFVHPEWLQIGIGSALFAHLLAELRVANPELAQLTVSSSPFAVPIYERFGFEIAGPPLVISGIEHIPMTFDLA